MRAIRIESFGGPEVLQLVTDQPEPEPTPGMALLEVSRIGVNYADTHQVENSYLAPTSLPFVPGAEAVGTTPDGQRKVALLSGGGYAERALAPEASSFDLPDEVDDGQALALVLQGLTAWHLLRTSAHLAPGETVVVHAAAGGVGTLAVQLAKAWGAGRVIAVASSASKRQLALDLGADAAVDSAEPVLTKALRDAAGGDVDIVLDMVGGRTTDQSLSALAPFGRLVFFGMASRELPRPVELGPLMNRSRAVVGFWLVHAFSDPARLLAAPMQELLAMTAAGDLRPVVGGTYGLSQAAQAHRDLRARTTVGKLLLDPAT